MNGALSGVRPGLGQIGGGAASTVASRDFCTRCAGLVDDFEDVVDHHAVVEVQRPIWRNAVELLGRFEFSE